MGNMAPVPETTGQGGQVGFSKKATKHCLKIKSFGFNVSLKMYKNLYMQSECTCLKWKTLCNSKSKFKVSTM